MKTLLLHACLALCAFTCLQSRTWTEAQTGRTLEGDFVKVQGDREMGAGTYTSSGKRIDATGTEGQFAGKKYEGIFDLDSKTLKWCSANDNPNSTRPTRLQTNPQAGQFLMVLEKK